MIDDLEDGDRFLCSGGSNGRNGAWYTIDDGSGSRDLSPSPTGVFTPTLIPGGRGTSRYAARMTGSGFTLWGTAMLFYLNGQVPAVQPYDASTTQGIRFWMKSVNPVGVYFLLSDTSTLGDPGGTCVNTPTERNCDNDFAFQITSPNPGEWVEYEVPYTAARQPFLEPDANGNPIGGSATWNPSHLLGVQFNGGRTPDLWIDDVRFYSCATADCVPTCTDPDAPVACPARGGEPAACWPAGTDCSIARLISFNGVWGSGPSDVWAVGSMGTRRAGAIAHWNGAVWSSVTSGTPFTLTSVWGSSSTDVWAVGNNGTILHWNGSFWSATPSSTPGPLYSVWGSGPNDVWAVGKAGAVVHWNGAAWSAVASGTAYSLYGVWGSDLGDVWAVGHSDNTGAGIIVHWDGSAWSPASGSIPDVLGAVWGSGPRDVWALGYSFGGAGESIITHWDGSAWSFAPSGTIQPLYSVWGSGPRDVWTVGELGTILHSDGLGWSEVVSGNTNSLFSVWGSGPGDAWAVGVSGSMLHWDGSAWSAAPIEPLPLAQ